MKNRIKKFIIIASIIIFCSWCGSTFMSDTIDRKPKVSAVEYINQLAEDEYRAYGSSSDKRFIQYLELRQADKEWNDEYENVLWFKFMPCMFVMNLSIVLLASHWKKKNDVVYLEKD